MMAGRASHSSARRFFRAFFATEIRSWRGEEPLWKVFWISGVVRSCGGAAIYGAALYTGHVALQQVLLPLFAVYTVWILVSIWRCADNSEEKWWGLLARLLTVAWAVNAIMLLTFLQLDLVTGYFGR